MNPLSCFTRHTHATKQLAAATSTCGSPARARGLSMSTHPLGYARSVPRSSTRGGQFGYRRPLEAMVQGPRLREGSDVRANAHITILGAS